MCWTSAPVPATARSTSTSTEGALGGLRGCLGQDGGNLPRAVARWWFHDFTWLQLFDYPLPLATASFDAVLCFETVEHVAQPERLVAELGRVTKPGGTLILTTPNVLWEPVHALAAITGLHHSEGPHRFIRYGRLQRMIVDAGFEIEHAETTVASARRAGAAWSLASGWKRSTQAG